MRPYICISHASADADAAQRFLRELTRYGFRYEAPDESVPRREREACLLNAEAVIVLTSPAAAESGICAADIRLLLGRFCASAWKKTPWTAASAPTGRRTPSASGTRRAKRPTAVGWQTISIACTSTGCAGARGLFPPCAVWTMRAGG